MTTADAPPIEKLPFDQRTLAGPFDIIGDVHGCADELIDLLGALGYAVDPDTLAIHPPERRKAIFVGDLIDRGPRSPDVLRLVMRALADGQALAVLGNHDVKFVRWLKGQDIKISHGLDRTIEQMSGEDESFKAEVLAFYAKLPHYVWLDGGALAVAHAGLKDGMLGDLTGAIKSFCLYGETSGETDEFGLPIRYHWAAEYKGATAVIYGHTPVPTPDWVNNTLCIDTGCCFGGALSALRWPEREIIAIPARRTYTEPVRAFGHPPVRPR